jgi:DNA ligase 1
MFEQKVAFTGKGVSKLEIVELKNQFDAVATAKGKAKIPLIRSFATSNDLFLETYNFVFNPFITTGIAKKKIQKDLGALPRKDSLHILDMFEYVEENNSGSDAIIRNVQSWILAQHPETHEFLTNVFINDLQIGASEKALNEALGYEYIPVHEILLAKRWEKEEHKIKDGEEFFVTLKMDDYRCTVIFNEEIGEWELKARSGFPFEDVVEIQAIFNTLPKDLVYDGGLISTDTSLKAKDRFRHTGKLLRTDGPKKNIMFYIYDMLPKSEFKAGKSKDNYKVRQDKITDFMITHNLTVNPLFEQVPRLYSGTDKEEIWPLLETVLAEEYEGLMVNTAKGKYETKRSDQLLKVKEFHTVDLRVVDTYEYKHPGNLGGFICEYKDGNTVRVGGGFKKHERAEWWPKRDEFIGKIIEVKYFQESTNQNGGKSIRHGHFVGLRWDKTEPSFE